jgi:hypothetical protein
MSGKIIAAAAAAVLLGSTAFASAADLAAPQDQAYVDGYGWSYGETGPSFDPHYGIAPAPYGGGYGGYYDDAPGYGYDYVPGSPGWRGGEEWDQ